MPCEWLVMGDKICIVVLREVNIPPPYTPEVCHGGAALPRVQKVLAGITQRLKPA